MIRKIKVYTRVVIKSNKNDHYQAFIIQIHVYLNLQVGRSIYIC